MEFKETFYNGNKSKGRIIQPTGVGLHHFALPLEDLLLMSTQNSGVLSCGTKFKHGISYHCAIEEDGTRHIFGKDTDRMWHAGESIFKGIKDCNSFLLGVAFLGDTNKKPLTFEQITSFIEWFIPRMIEHYIKKDWITDHRTIAPSRKVDLNPIELNRILVATENLWR